MTPNITPEALANLIAPMLDGEHSALDIATAVLPELLAAQPQGGSPDVDAIAAHMHEVVQYIERAYPGAKMLDTGPILRNLRRWSQRLRNAKHNAQPASSAGGQEYRVSAGPATGWSPWFPGTGDQFEADYQVERRAAPVAGEAAQAGCAYVADLEAEVQSLRQRAIRAHQICNLARVTYPQIGELGDDGCLHEAIHDILRVDRAISTAPAAVPVDALPGDLRWKLDHLRPSSCGSAGLTAEEWDYVRATIDAKQPAAQGVDLRQFRDLIGFAVYQAIQLPETDPRRDFIRQASEFSALIDSQHQQKESGDV